MSTWIKNKRNLTGLSQGEVAKSLGISRPTYSKLEQGTLKPTEQQKGILGRIFHMSPENVAKNALESAIVPGEVVMREIPHENAEKFKEVLLYILGKIGSRPNIGQTVLYKLLYFMDFDYYEKYEEQLIGATYIKNTYGPTPISFAKIVKQMQADGSLVEVKSKYFDKNQTKYVPVRNADVSSLSGRELHHVDEVIERLGHLNATDLSKLSHQDTPWKVAREKEEINYEHVFYRSEETSVRAYEPL
jgi:transcriptional regulator with XRE-family HTH domain